MTNTVSIENIEALKNLKLKLSKNAMSVLIGAGFSVNVHELFPTWWGLIYDMGYDMFNTEAKKRYLESNKSINEKEYVENFVSNQIEEIGFLELVSLYEKKKGFRETISIYIEERTPYVKKTDNGLILFKGDEKVILEDNSLALHKSLLKVDWNNIYTTNYDNLLEITNSELNSNTKDLKSIQKGIKESIEKKIKNIRDLNLKLKKEEKEEENKTKSILSEEDIKSSNIQTEISTLKSKLNYEERGLEQLEKEFSEIELILNNQINVITNSSKLSVKKNKNIIKLHGSLRVDDNNYCFDNDYSKQYIITKEDYDNYPKKHEAFTQLMRISLLQESYCLIGFSGDDPNFKEWLKWVRDVINKDGKSTNKDYKIYLIGFKSDSRKDLKLFYENNRIKQINLADSKTIDFLVKETGEKIENRASKKNLLSLFLNYLNNHSNKYFDNYLELKKHKEYYSLWKNIDTGSISKPNNKGFIDNYDEIVKTHSDFTFNNLKNLPTQSQRFLFFNGINICKKNFKSKGEKEKIIHLILISFKDSLLNLSNKLNKQELKYVVKYLNKESEILFDKLYIQSEVLNNNFKLFKKKTEVLKINIDIKTYEEIKFNSFNFNFYRVKDILLKWKPQTNKYLLIKYCFTALFDKEKAYKGLKENKSIFNSDSTEIQMYYLNILRYFTNYYNSDEREKANRILEQIKTSGAEDLHDIFKHFINNETVKNKITPFNKHRFSDNKTTHFGASSYNTENAIQFLNLLLKIGLPVSIPHTYFLNKEDWYNDIFVNIYEIYPYPSLFISLQYDDKDFIQRVAQDYQKSEKLKPVLKDILTKLLTALKDENSPSRIKNSIYYFTSVIISNINAKVWDKNIVQFFSNDYLLKKAQHEVRSAEYIFLIEILKYTKSEKIIENTILFSLSNSDERNVIDLLYHLNNNYLFKNYTKKIPQKINKLIDELINRINENEDSWFIVGNLNSILSESQKKHILDKIKTQNFKTLKNHRLYSVILFFSNGNYYEKMRESILNNEKLWDSGISPDSKSASYPDFIKINSLKNNYKKLFRKKEIKSLFDKIQPSIILIEKWLMRDNNRNGFISFTEIINEIVVFLEIEKEILKEKKEFSSIYNKALMLNKESKGYESILDGLLSSSKHKIIWSLSDFYNYLYYDITIPNKETIADVILNKILLFDKDSFEATLNYLELIIKYKKTTNLFTQHKEKILLILKKYKEFKFEENDLLFIQKKFVNISKTMKSEHKLNNPILNYWINLKIIN